MSACSLRGFHGIIVVIPGGHQKDSLKHLHAFFIKLANALKSSQLGLTSTTFALVADKPIQSTCHPLGAEWTCFSEATPPPAAGPRQHTRGNHRRSAEGVGVGAHVRTLEPLEKAIQALDEELDSNFAGQPREQNCTWVAMATQLHSLLDTSPWRPLDHTELSLYWLVSESENVPPPDSAVALYSALERLLAWHRGHVTITCDSPATESRMHQWTTALKSPSAVLTSSWSPPVGVVWRGAVHFTEHKTFHDAYLNTAIFQGFALSLADRTVAIQPASVAMVMEGVGLDPRKPFIPTHLEVVQILEVSTVPHLLLSPLQCTLSLINPVYSDSAQLFHQWFTKRLSTCNHVGFLMRLCSVERKDGARRLTSADWFNHILTRDLPITATSMPSALDCYQPGPMVLVCPREDLPENALSCDCWFLWQHKALHLHLLKDLCPSVPVMKNVDSSIGIHDTFSHLPLLATSSTPVERGNDLVDLDSTQLWKTISGAKCEVDMSPSDWPEITAMKTHEWMQRKLVHKSKTPDLLFGQPVPPPPSTTPENSLCVGSVLECFAEDGSPTVQELSPVALQDPANMVKIFDPKEAGSNGLLQLVLCGVDISFQSIAGTTPTSKKLIHGIHYCLTAEDLAMDARLQRLQHRCLASERATHCFSSNTPLQKRRRPLCALEDDPVVRGDIVAADCIRGATSSDAVMKFDCTREVPGKNRHQSCDGVASKSTHTHLSSKFVPTATIRRGIKRKLDLKQPASCDSGAGSTENGYVTRTENDLSEGGTQASFVPDTLPRQAFPHSLGVSRPDANNSGVRTHEKSPHNEDAGICEVTKGPRVDVKKTEKDSTKDSRKKLLERTIVAVLKGSMSRDHPCFRQCYDRLFNLCKTFLKDVRNPEQFAEEMERTVNFNVKQVIEFELRQAGLNL